MEAVLVFTTLASTGLVAEDEADLDDPGQTSGHEGVSKYCVHHSAERKSLGVSRHSPAGQEDDETGDKVAFGTSVSVPAEPDSDQTGTPPNYPHARVLEIVVDPGTTPSVFGKGVDTAPRGNDE